MACNKLLMHIGKKGTGIKRRVDYSLKNRVLLLNYMGESYGC